MKDSKKFSIKEILILLIQIVVGFLLAFIGAYLEVEHDEIMGLCLVPFGVAFILNVIKCICEKFDK